MKASWVPLNREHALSIMRIVIALNFMSHGLQKTFGLLGGTQMPLMSRLGLAGIIELLGGLLIMSGLFTRPAAFVCSGQMAVAYFTQHAPHGFWPVVNRGELAVLYCFVFLYLIFAGPGPWSLDRILRGIRR